MPLFSTSPLIAYSGTDLQTGAPDPTDSVRRQPMIPRRDFLKLLSVAAIAPLAGCSNPPTGLVSTQDEISMGQQAAQQFEAQTPTREDPQVDAIASRLVAVQPRKDLPWSYRVAQTNDVNAFALPGGFIFVYQGLMDAIHGDTDMLAATMGHETSHVVLRHGVKLMVQQMGTQAEIAAVIGLATHGRDPQALQAIGAVASSIITNGYSRDDEYAADHLGVILMNRAGYNPEGMVRLLETLQQVAPNSGGGLTKYFENHPGTPSRIQRVKDQIARGDIT